MARSRPLRILHLGPDSQFVQFAAEVFEEVAPGSNHYLIFGPQADGTLKYPIASGPVEVAVRDHKTVLALLLRRWRYDLIVAHYMTQYSGAVFARAGRKTVTLWSGWGGDYYDRWELTGPLTRELLSGFRSIAPAVKRSFRERAVGFTMNKLNRRLVDHAAARADLFSAPVPADEAVFRSRFPQFRGGYAQLNYASVESSFTAPQPTGSERSGILIGNSAMASNNHLEAFELLARHDVRGRQVVVPLSYGSGGYRDAVIERGRELFGADFLPLVEPLPLAEYNALISGCGIVIMNQKRQQALGNIGTALNAGATIYLDESNPVYRFLKESGAVLRSTAELATADALPAALTADEAEANRAFLEGFWGTRRVRDNVAALLRTIRA